MICRTTASMASSISSRFTASASCSSWPVSSSCRGRQRPLQLRAQDAARLRDAPLHGADRRAEQDADLLVGVIAGAGQQQRIAQLVRKRADQLAQRSLQFGRRQRFVVRPVGRCDALEDVGFIVGEVRPRRGPAAASGSRALRRSMAFRQAIDSSHVLNADSARKLASLRYAVTNVSCATSSASAALPTAASAARNTARRLRSTSSPNASESPACAWRTRSRSESAAGSVPFTR